jgi:hypothetical protein
VQPEVIRERVKVLQDEIARLRAASREYLSSRRHTPLENIAQRTRELRLEQILRERTFCGAHAIEALWLIGQVIRVFGGAQ